MGLNFDEKRALINYRIQKARNSLIEATDNATLGHWSLVANRLYYSLFHAATALLTDKGMTAKTHGGLIRLIGLNFVETSILSTDDGRLIATLFRMRQAGDYDDLFDWEREQVEPLIAPTKQPIDKITGLLTLV